jgi:hypothetical protein
MEPERPLGSRFGGLWLAAMSWDLGFLLFAALVTALGWFAFMSVLEGWRRRSEDRRIREHFRH